MRVPPERESTQRLRLGGAQRLCPPGGRTRRGNGEPMRSRELQRPDPRPTPAGAAREAKDHQPRYFLRQAHRRRPSAVLEVWQRPGQPTRPDPGLPLLDIKPTPQPIEGTRTLLTFADGAPALIERAFKGPKPGRVLLWTTPLSPGAGPANRPRGLERASQFLLLVFPV